MKLFKIKNVKSDNYQNHQMLRNFFPKGKILWKRYSGYLLVLSNSKTSSIIEVDTLINMYHKLKCDMMPFSIRINACKTVNGKRYCLLEEDIEDWTKIKLLNNGFTVKHMHIYNEGYITSIRKNKPNCHGSVHVVGYLSVDDDKMFIDTLQSGIGHAKAYGFGMLDIFQYV